MTMVSVHCLHCKFCVVLVLFNFTLALPELHPAHWLSILQKVNYNRFIIIITTTIAETRAQCIKSVCGTCQSHTHTPRQAQSLASLERDLGLVQFGDVVIQWRNALPHTHILFNQASEAFPSPFVRSFIN